jgi:hypothetical protein
MHRAQGGSHIAALPSKKTNGVMDIPPEPVHKSEDATFKANTSCRDGGAGLALQHYRRIRGMGRAASPVVMQAAPQAGHATLEQVQMRSRRMGSQHRAEWCARLHR